MSDSLAWSSAYVRVTDADGSEPDVDQPLSLDETVVETLAVFDQRDPLDGWLFRSAYYQWWAPLPDSPDRIFEYQDGVEVEYEHRSIDHPLRETAQWLDTPVGCFPNPDRDPERAAATPGPGVPAASATPAAPPAEAPTASGPVEAFVDAAVRACDLSAIPDPATAVAVSAEGADILVRDVNGVELVVNVETGEVTGTDGPDGLMPHPYSFACDPNVFRGAADA